MWVMHRKELYTDMTLQEELKFEAAEYEAEREAEVAKQDELELKLFKGMNKKR